MSQAPGELLVRDGVISAEALRRALSLRAQEGGSLGECLIRLGVIDEQALAHFYHRRLVLPLVAANRLAAIEPAVLRLVPAEVAAEFRAVPIAAERDGSVLVAMADPSDNHAVEELGFFVGQFVLRGVATESVIRRAIEHHYKVPLTPFTPPAHASAPLPAKGAPSPRARSPIPAHEERDTEPFAARSRTVSAEAAEIVLLTKKKRSDETPLPPHAPPRGEPTPVVPHLLDHPRPRERSHTLPGVSPSQRVKPPILALRGAADRDTVARLVLDYAAQFVGRATLFVVRKGILAGFDARGGGLDRASVEVLQIPLATPSIFRDVTNALLPFRGTLPDTAQNRTIARAIGVAPTAEVLLWPIRIRDRVIAVLWGDEVAPLLPESDLQSALHEAGLAYARIILQGRGNADDPQR